MITFSNALISLRPGADWYCVGNEYAGLVWRDEIQSPPTEDEINAEIERLTALEPLIACKVEAKRLIAASDWSALPDVNLANKSDFEAYRAQLRALIIAPVANPSWPTEPQPVWSVK